MGILTKAVFPAGLVMLSNAGLEITGVTDIELPSGILENVDEVSGQRRPWRSRMAARVGIEPTTKWLTATCSTAELPGNFEEWSENRPPV